MEIKKNGIYICRVIRINAQEVDYQSALVIDENYITEIEIKDVEKTCYDSIKEEAIVNIVVKCDTSYMTIADCKLIKNSFRCGPDRNNVKIDLKFISSLLLIDYLWNPSKEMKFKGMDCSVTEITELLGVYPYEIEYDPLGFPQECNVKGDIVYKTVGHGFSYFVVPSIVREPDGLHISMYGRIQYFSDREIDISELLELRNNICLFFEILSGESIAIGDVFFGEGDNFVKVVGLCNFPKDKLTGLQSSFNARKDLRKGIFKVSDFGDDIEQAITAFDEIRNECMLACEAYKQILLDEEIKIGTYNKFLKVMQVVEGFQRAKIDENEELEFAEKKNQILAKLDEDDRAFVDKYTTYNGQKFRKCLKEFTLTSLQIISGLTGKEAKIVCERVIDKIKNDRDTYTHASKKEKPSLSRNELQAVNYCYKSFFRVLVLSRMGLNGKIIRNRLLFDRRFVDFYQRLFGLEIMKEDSYTNTGEFDDLMW